MPKRQRRYDKCEYIKQQIVAVDAELYRLKLTRWNYAKNMLRFGLAAWSFGLSFFFFTVITAKVQLFRTEQAYMSLLVMALAAPVIVAAFFSHNFTLKIKRIERTRADLLNGYHRASIEEREAKSPNSVKRTHRMGVT